LQRAYDYAAKANRNSIHAMLHREATMRLTSLVAALALSLIFPALPAWAQVQASGSDADSAAIKKVCADFSENFSRHDARSVAMTFAEDADFTNTGGIATAAPTSKSGSPGCSAAI
jgi:hypothetical protein